MTTCPECGAPDHQACRPNCSRVLFPGYDRCAVCQTSLDANHLHDIILIDPERWRVMVCRFCAAHARRDDHWLDIVVETLRHRGYARLQAMHPGYQRPPVDAREWACPECGCDVLWGSHATTCSRANRTVNALSAPPPPDERSSVRPIRFREEEE